jgi:hypothetical protein
MDVLPTRKISKVGSSATLANFFAWGSHERSVTSIRTIYCGQLSEVEMPLLKLVPDITHIEISHLKIIEPIVHCC